MEYKEYLNPGAPNDDIETGIKNIKPATNNNPDNSLNTEDGIDLNDFANESLPNPTATVNEYGEIIRKSR